MKNRNHDTGAVLVISLLLLLVITLVGLSSLNTTTLEEKMTSNMQAKHAVFQTADTVIEEAIDDTDFLWRAYVKGLNVNADEREVFTSTSDLHVSFAVDEEGEAVPLQFSARQVAAEFKGTTVPVGSNATSIRLGSSGYQLYHYYLEATAELADQKARAIHMQGAYLKGASTSQ